MPGTESKLAALETMSSVQLREHWAVLTATPVPRISPAMLRLALAWEIQARAQGGLPRAVSQRLTQLTAAKTTTAPVTAGLRLVREWQGQAHVVTVGEDQVMRWNGRDYRSLSEVARAITGTRWSGPAFFGLKRKVAA